MVTIVRLGITYGVVRLYHIRIVQPITFCLDTRMISLLNTKLKLGRMRMEITPMSTKMRMRLRAHE